MALSKSFIRNAAMTPLDARRANMAQMVCNADGSPRTGVIGNPGANIVATTGTMNVTVAAAEFATSKGKADGVAIFTNDGVVNVAIGAAPASNSRIDVVWVKHFDDTTGDTAGQSLPLFGVTPGAAAASPTKPAIPTGALELATLRVYAGTTATNGGSNTLTNTYQMTASRGGVVPFRTKVELDAWTKPVDGQFAQAAGKLYQRSSGAWSPVSGEDTGWITPTLTGGWLDFGPPYTPIRYRRINGLVYIEGVGKNGGTGATTFTLPVGFRPGSTKIFATPANAGVADVRAQTTGEVFVGGYYAGGSNQIVGFSLPPFMAEA